MTGSLDTARAVLGDLGRSDAPLGARTTYRVGGSAALLVEVASVDDIARAGRAAAAAGLPVVVMGRGSNVLVADRGFDGVAVVTGDGLDDLTIDGTAVEAGAGVSLPVLARRTVAAGLTGLEWAVGVPGSVGGAVRMNAGGHGSDMAADLSSATVVDLRTGEVSQWAADRLGLGYRRSALAPHHVVVSARFALTRGETEQGEAEIAAIVGWRRTHQPGGHNSGSVFTNPPGDAAGRLIDASGLKGHRLGSAEVSPKHANFIQADPGGRADDVLALVVEIQRRVAEDTGVRLRPELRLIGYDEATARSICAGRAETSELTP